LPRLHLGDVTVDKVANAFAMSRKTLHRRLKEEGVTFLSIHDDLKHRMAIEYLTARKVSVNQVAYLVGFSEPSSFVRAFRRWRSMTPSEFLTQNTVASVNA
jgi:AraC-like DNA-binding protein